MKSSASLEGLSQGKETFPEELKLAMYIKHWYDLGISSIYQEKNGLGKQKI